MWNIFIDAELCKPLTNNSKIHNNKNKLSYAFNTFFINKYNTFFINITTKYDNNIIIK